MSEYTPTTEEVRNGWVSCAFEGGAGMSDAAYEDAQWDDERAEAQFDRWLAAHDEQVRAEERERIAQAVAPLLNELESTPSTGYYAPWAEATQVAIFKEIRGEGSDNDH